MEQRETPHGILGNLARALAPKSKPISSSSTTSASSPPPSRRRRSSIRPPREEEEADEDDFVDQDDDVSSEDPPLKRPRLSLPIDDPDDDDEDLRPPRLSGVEQFDYTLQPFEMSRRVANEQRPSLLPRSSMGSFPGSEGFEDEVTGTTVGRPSDFLPGLLEDINARFAHEGDTLQR